MLSFNLVISTPQRLFFSGEVQEIIFTSTEGSMGVLARHAPMVAAFESCPLRMKIEDEWKWAALSGGFVEITGDKVVILADTAEWPEEIELNRALEAKKRAEERIRSRLSEVEYLQSQVALKRAIARIKVFEDSDKRL